jgi:hypothetical protein
MLRKLIYTGALALFLIPTIAPTIAMAEKSCFSDLPCAQEGKKCNIHFKNLTGRIDKNTCRASSYSNAATVKIKARDQDGNQAGKSLNLMAGQTGTMNFSTSKKWHTQSVKVMKEGKYEGSTLSCDDLRSALKGSGKCKLYSHWDKDTNGSNNYLYLVAAAATSV